MRNKLAVCGFAALTTAGGATFLAAPVVAAPAGCTLEQTAILITMVHGYCRDQGYDGGYATNMQCNEYGGAATGECWNL